MKETTVHAIVNAPLHLVWERYTLPEHIVQWNFAVPEWHCPSASNDLRPGGLYRARMEARDGSFGFDFEARYDRIEPEKLLAYTMTDGRKATVEFNADGAATHVSVRFELENENPAQMQHDGWQAILNSFKRYAESA